MPEQSTIHVDAPLTNVAIGYPTQGFIAARLLTDLPVRKKSDLYFIFDSAKRAQAASDDAREAGAEAREEDFAVSTGSYICAGHALRAAVPDEERENADAPISPMIDKTEFLVNKVLTNMEISLAAQLASEITATSDPTNEWDDYTNGDPIADMKLAIDAVEDATGFKPNVMSMDTKVWRALKFHPAILEKVIYGGSNGAPADISPQAVAALFDLEEVIIGNPLKNTAVLGQTASMSRIWGSDVYVAYRPPRAGLKIPALGYRFTWEPFSGGTNGWMVSTWRSEERKSDLVQVDKYFVHKITLAAAAYRLQNRLS
jgi:hypothetical protein